MSEIKLTLPYPISANRYWATRVIKAKATGQWMAMTYTTPEARAYKEQVSWIAHGAGVRKPLVGRMFVDIELYPHRPLDYKKRMKADPVLWADTVMRLDLDNARKVLYDALKGVVFGDDKCVWDDAGHVREPDGRDACVIVTIKPIVLQQPQQGLPMDMPVPEVEPALPF